MDRSEILRQVASVLTGELAVAGADVAPGTMLREDLGLDSIDLVELVTAFEDRLGRRVPEDRLGGLDTVDDVVTLVGELVAEGEGVSAP